MLELKRIRIVSGVYMGSLHEVVQLCLENPVVVADVVNELPSTTKTMISAGSLQFL